MFTICRTTTSSHLILAIWFQISPLVLRQQHIQWMLHFCPSSSQTSTLCRTRRSSLIVLSPLQECIYISKHVALFFLYFAAFSTSCFGQKTSSLISQQALRWIPIADSLTSNPLNLFRSVFPTPASNENEWMPCSAAKMETGGWCLRAGVGSAASERERLLSILLCLKYFTWFWCLAALTETDAFGQQDFFSLSLTSERLMTTRMLYLSVPDLLSCQGVLVGQLLLMDPGVPKNKQTMKNYCILELFSFNILNISILHAFEKAAAWQT